MAGRLHPNPDALRNTQVIGSHAAAEPGTGLAVGRLSA